MQNIMTIDVEDYFHVSGLASVIDKARWDQYPCYVAENTLKLLAIFAKHRTKVTFFVLGWVAERYPEIVEAMSRDGHEVASHGYGHQLVYEIGPEAFYQDVTKAKHLLEDITGQAILGYRAPSASVTRNSFWALDILYDTGHQYDASIYPIVHDRYGIPDAPRFPHILQTERGRSLWEVPFSTLRVGQQNVPIAGGGYFRMFPYAYTRWGIKTLNNERQPAVVYIHPWEIHQDQPRHCPGMLNRFRHYVNLSQTEKRLHALLRHFEFAPIREHLGMEAQISNILLDLSAMPGSLGPDLQPRQKAQPVAAQERTPRVLSKRVNL